MIKIHLIAAIALVIPPAANAIDSTDLKREATWSQPTAPQVRLQLDAWLDGSDTVSENARAEIRKKWDSFEPQSTDEVFRGVLASIAIAEPRANEIIDFCRNATSTVELPPFEWLRSGDVDPFVANNLRLHYGQWLGLRSLYNEVLEQLDGMQPEDVVDPASLLFFQAVAHHRLLDKENGLPLIARLMENSDAIPRRYATMARLMEADIKPLKEDSLDEISRLMENIKTRLKHGRAGKRVRKEEEDVIAKLDKKIEDLEKQAQKQKQQSQSQQQSQGQQQGSQPMQDSQIADISGPGNSKPKDLGDETDWGDLPPKEREAALQELGKDLPSHYRDVIEEYFQKLAKEE